MKKIILIIIFMAIIGLYFSFLNSNEGSRSASQNLNGDVQEINIVVDGTNYPGYFPDKTEIKKGVPTRLNFITKKEQSCALAINIPEAGVNNKILPETGKTTIEYTPKDEGKISIFCGMNGMFNAFIKVLA